MNKKQFLITNEAYDIAAFNKIKINETFYLYVGQDLEYGYVLNKNSEIHLLGAIYDWENPEYSNQDILKTISQYACIEDLIHSTHKYYGEFIIIAILDNKFYIFNDACAQREVYYDTKYNSFGSQPKVIGEVARLIDHTDIDANAFYQSYIFKKHKLFVGTSTHKKNIHHLLPNHYIDVTGRKVVRFFPSKVLPERSLDEVASKVALMLKGFIKAVSHRSKIRMAVTGGFDSRVLFLASLETNCKYFVIQHPHMNYQHPDIAIPQKLTSMFEKEFEVLSESSLQHDEFDQNYIESIDFPRYLQTNGQEYSKYTTIHGSISEIGRNIYGLNENFNARDICYLMGYGSLNFAVNQYDEWLTKSKGLFRKYNYNYLDMLYWEQRTGIWGAKRKSETEALGLNSTTPFNSKELISQMLSVKPKYRDYYFSPLHKKIIYYLSQGNEEVSKIPFFSGNDPDKMKIIMMMKKFKVYNLYRYFGVKTRTLRL